MNQNIYERINSNLIILFQKKNLKNYQKQIGTIMMDHILTL